MQSRNKLFIAACVLIITAAVLCSCSGLPGAGNSGEMVPFMENVRTGTLPSGMRYFILENSKPENRAYLTLAVNAGSVLEENDERGLAHFTEHMAFRGTERFPEAELINYLRSLGMRFGPEVNAYTGFDQTVYGIEVPVETGNDEIKRIPDTAQAVIDDWSRAVSFAHEAVESERQIVLEEYRSRLGAWNRIRQKWLPVLFRGSPYAERLPIGLPEIIESAPASRLEGFYKKWYRADNMALILVGDFDGKELEASLSDHFLIGKPAPPTLRPVFDLLPPKKGVETLILGDPELTSTNIYLYFKRSREAAREDISYYRSEIIDVLIDRMLSLRFNDELNKPETPYMHASAGTARYGASSRFYVMAARAKSGTAGESLNELLRAREAMLRYGFTETELALASNSLVSDMQRMVQEKDRQESEKHVDALVSYYLEGGNLASLEWELNAILRLLPHIKTKDINAAIKNYFAADDLQVFIFAPDAELPGLPDDKSIRQMVKDSRKMKIARPKSAKQEGSLLSTPAERGEIVSQSANEETGAVIWELENGAKVILKNTVNKNNEVVLQAMARGGILSAKEEDDISASLAVEMLQVSGLGPWPRPELTRKLSGKQVSLSHSVSSYYRGFRGSASTDDLATLFEMVYLSFTDPRIDPVAVKAMMEQYKTSLALRSENPATVFSDEINRTICSNHPRFKPLELADLPKADINAALAFIRKGLNPKDFTFIFTGNLNLSQIKDYVESYIASIPAMQDTWNNWTDPGIIRPGKIEKNVFKGREEQSKVYMAWYTNSQFNEELNAQAQVLSEYLDIRMTDEIREKLGGVYSISANVSVSPVPRGELSMSVYFACDPKRTDELAQAVQILLNQTAAGSIDSSAFNKAGEALKKEWETLIQSNSYIAQSFANSSVLLNLPLSRLYKRPQYYGAVTPADIQKLCSALLPNGPARITLYPQK